MAREYPYRRFLTDNDCNVLEIHTTDPEDPSENMSGIDKLDTFEDKRWSAILKSPCLKGNMKLVLNHLMAV
ncbi:hypothetical protein ACTXT7_011324 [Hymenolepis weldensis]